MKDFMMLLCGVEVRVMSIWFLCTVCRKVRRGRTTLLAGQGGDGVLLLGGCSSSSSSCCSSSSSLTACL